MKPMEAVVEAISFEGCLNSGKDLKAIGYGASGVVFCHPKTKRDQKLTLDNIFRTNPDSDIEPDRCAVPFPLFIMFPVNFRSTHETLSNTHTFVIVLITLVSNVLFFGRFKYQ